MTVEPLQLKRKLSSIRCSERPAVAITILNVEPGE